MSQKTRVALVGSSGMLGSVVVKDILERTDLFDLTIVTRKDSTNPLPGGMRKIVVESYEEAANDATLIKGLRGQDVLVSMLNSAVAVKVEPSLVEAAIQANVKRFMPSEYTLDVTHPAARELGAGGNFIGARTAWADKLAEIAASGRITYTTLMTGGFLDWGLKSGMLGFNSATDTAKLYDHGEHKVTACTVPFVAAAVVAALQMPEEQVSNQRIHVAEVEYTGRELLGVFERGTGQKWDVQDISTDALRKMGRQALAEGNARGAYLNFALTLNFDGSGASTLSEGLNFGQGYGLHRRSLVDVVRDVLGPSEV